MLATLLPDWLKAKGRRPGTITSYMTVAKTFNAFLVESGMPTEASGITREHIEHFLADLFDHAKPATVAKHYRTLQQLSKFLVDDGEIPSSPMERMSPPLFRSNRCRSSLTSS